MKKKEHVFELDEQNIALIEKLFRMSMDEFLEKIVGLESEELLLSRPINVKSNQYLFIISKSDSMGSYIIRFCKGPSFTKEILKETKVRLISHIILVGTIPIIDFFNECLVMDGLYDSEYKAFKDFVNPDFLFCMIQDYVLGDKKGMNMLKDYIESSLKEQIANAYLSIKE